MFLIFLQISCHPHPISPSILIATIISDEGYAVSQSIEALCYKPEGCGFDSRLGHWGFSLPYSFRLHHGSGIDSAFKRNEYQCYHLEKR